MTQNELQAACREYRELARMQEDIKAELDAIKETITQAMGEADTLTAGEYKISYKLVTSSCINQQFGLDTLQCCALNKNLLPFA